MRILFITNGYLNLYKDIEEEMIRQGHEVSTALYQNISHDPYFVSPHLFSGLRRIFFVKICHIFDKYWKKRIKNESIFSEKYDVLFVINGESIGKYLIDHLTIINPDLKKIFYTWDTISYYRFDRLFGYFDKCYSFDLCDCRKYAKLRLLPIYYIEDASAENYEYEYDIMMIGINHDRRYEIVRQILPDLKNNNIRYFIKIIKNRGMIPYEKMNLKRFVVLNLSKYNLFYGPEIYSAYKSNLEFNKDEDRFDIKSEKVISTVDYRCISSKTRCILDTQRQTQSGLTARFMWALGNNKKIVTTNKCAFDYDFVDKKRVLIIDEDNPIIPRDFILSDLKHEKNTNLLAFRLDNWVRTILCV